MSVGLRNRKNDDSRKGAKLATVSVIPPFAKGDQGGFSNSKNLPLPLFSKEGVGEALCVLGVPSTEFILSEAEGLRTCLAR